MDYKPSRNMREDSNHGPAPNTTEKNTHDDSFFHNLYGMTKFMKICGSYTPTIDEL